jgi:hypothetical protein
MFYLCRRVVWENCNVGTSAAEAAVALLRLCRG